MGTSVRVAKCMNAPATEAKRLAPRELRPTAPGTHGAGMSQPSGGAAEAHFCGAAVERNL